MINGRRPDPGRPRRSGGDRAVVTSAASPRSRAGRVPRRSLTVLRRIGRVVAAVVVTFAVLLGIAWVVTPSVDDAQQLVSAELAANGGTPLQGDVPDNPPQALIAPQDSRFEHHIGIDAIGAVRAGWGALTGDDEGGSTLDQQLAKNLYAGGQQGAADRVQSVVLALKLDATWSKDQLLRMYLDDGYYGHGFYGLTAATEGYFGVPPQDLDWAQATLLAGLFQAPTAYDRSCTPIWRRSGRRTCSTGWCRSAR